MTASYALLWLAGLVSNSFAAAQQICVAWTLSGVGVPTRYIAFHQMGTVVAGLAGASLGAVMSRRVGRHRALTFALCLSVTASMLLSAAASVHARLPPEQAPALIIAFANLGMFAVCLWPAVNEI